MESASGLPCVQGYQLHAAAPLILPFFTQCVVFLLRHAGLPLVFSWWFLVPNEARQLLAALGLAPLLQQLCPLSLLLPRLIPSAELILLALELLGLMKAFVVMAGASCLHHFRLDLSLLRWRCLWRWLCVAAWLPQFDEGINLLAIIDMW
jgi:hypothetical protein